jgi:hypothetical protein
LFQHLALQQKSALARIYFLILSLAVHIASFHYVTFFARARSSAWPALSLATVARGQIAKTGFQISGWFEPFLPKNSPRKLGVSSTIVRGLICV